MSRRGTRNTKGLLWAAGVLLVAVLALTSYAMFSGDDNSSTSGKGGTASPSRSGTASAAPTYTTPDDWTEPDRWAALPRGERTDKYGSQVGFPHTTEGAAAMMAAANSSDIENNRSTVDEQLRIYYSYMGSDGKSDKTAEQIELNAGQADKDLHRQLGIPAGSDLPSGAYMRTTVVAYKLLTQSADEVSGWVLAQVATKAGETAKETTTYTRTLVGVQWAAGDWKLSVNATVSAQQKAQSQTAPGMAAPGDAKFNTYGWTAIRAAS